ncbi:MAG: metallophosphoesterase, partial [Planctomycetes bacterium]|nr:metallophosphoesterase [Planctomycetota bacterium]
MPRRKIGCIADAHYADSDSPPLYRAQAIEKTTQAINGFLAEGVDAIVVLGDTIENPESAFDAPLRCQQMADLINGDGSVPHNRPVVWVIGNHDCDHASPPARFKTDFAACTGATITTNGTDHSGDTVRGFVDVADDLRIVYLDCCFNGSDVSLPVQLSYGTVSAAQLTWLEATLSDADAVGRWSIVCVHLPLKHGGDICGNAAAIRAILAQHRVLATLHGHKHWESLDTLDSNAAGEPIYEFVIPDLRNGNVYDIQSASPCSIVEVDTDVGQVAGYGGYFFPASYAAETIPGHSWDNPTFGWLTVVPAGA